MVDQTIALQVKPLDIATPLMQAAKMRQMDQERQHFEQEEKRDAVGQAAADIMAAPEGEHQQMWHGKMAELRSKGAITDEDYATLTNGYSPMNAKAMADRLLAKSMPLKDYLAYDLSRGGREADTAVGNAAARAISPGGAPPQGVLPPMSATPPTGYLGRQPVQPSATTWGDQEATDAGLYEKPAGGVPMPRPGPFAAPPASPLQQRSAAATAPQPSAAPQGGQSTTSPEMAAVFAKALTNPKTSEGTRKLATIFLEGYAKNQEFTPEGKNYRDYAADEISRGREPLSRMDYVTKMKQAGATAITNDMRGENAFDKTFGEANAKRYEGYINDGAKADKAIIDINNMRDISTRLGTTGVSAGVREFLGPYADALGLNVKGLSDIQAYTSIITRLAPQIRPVGSGTTSDFEFKQYLKALPGLSLNPVARTMTLDTMEALTRYDQSRRDIAIKLSTGEIKRVEAEKELRALPDPMKGFNTWRQANPGLYNDALKAPPQRSGATDNGPVPAELEAEMRRRGLLK